MLASRPVDTDDGRGKRAELQGQAGAASRRRLFVDLTAAIALPSQADPAMGRFGRDLARRLLRSNEPRAVPVAFRDGTLFAVPDDVIERLWRQAASARDAKLHWRAAGDPIPSDGERELPPDTTRPDGGARPPGGPASRALRWAARNAVQHLPASMREHVRAILIHSREIVRTLLRRPLRAAAAGSRSDRQPGRDTPLAQLRSVVHPQPGDVLFIGDVDSDFVPLRRLSEWRQASGLRVACVAARFSPDRRASRAAAVPLAEAVALIDAADLILTRSTARARELREVAAAQGRPAPPIEEIEFGHDPTRPASGTGALPARLAGCRFALVVGTVEAGSNLGLLLRCWRRLLAEDAAFTLDLVIVGRPGKGAAAAMSEIQAQPLINRVSWADSCPATLLGVLYENCHVVLCPGVTDAAAMAVDAALAHGREAFVADPAALPEAPHAAALLLDPSDEEAWVAALREAAARPARRFDPPAQPSGDEAAAVVLSALGRLHARASSEAG
jgi:glycosyltransferase involved in cell wall biosynthesis